MVAPHRRARRFWQRRLRTGGSQERNVTGERRERCQVIYPVRLGGWDPRQLDLGGWDLDVHHNYDPRERVIHFGNGRRRSAEAIGPIAATAAGNGSAGFSGDGGPATAAKLQEPRGIAIGPDGSSYIADSFNRRVRRVRPDGVIVTFAGNGSLGSGGDGGPATAASLFDPYAIALGPDGSLYIAGFGGRIRRVGTDGIIKTVAGNTIGFGGDGGPALSASLGSLVLGVAVARDGNLYIADTQNHRVRRVTPEGIITTIAGTGIAGYSGDGGLATAAKLNLPYGLALAPDGSLYIGDASNHVRRVRTNGIIETIAGNGISDSTGDGGSATAAAVKSPAGLAVARDGTLFIATDGRVRRATPDGIITTIAGDPFGSTVDGLPPLRSRFADPTGVALAQDGSYSVVDRPSQRVRRIDPVLPWIAPSDILISSEDGRDVYLFS